MLSRLSLVNHIMQPCPPIWIVVARAYTISVSRQRQGGLLLLSFLGKLLILTSYVWKIHSMRFCWSSTSTLTLDGRRVLRCHDVFPPRFTHPITINHVHFPMNIIKSHMRSSWHLTMIMLLLLSEHPLDPIFWLWHVVWTYFAQNSSIMLWFIIFGLFVSLRLGFF